MARVFPDAEHHRSIFVSGRGTPAGSQVQGVSIAASAGTTGARTTIRERGTKRQQTRKITERFRTPHEKNIELQISIVLDVVAFLCDRAEAWLETENMLEDDVDAEGDRWG